MAVHDLAVHLQVAGAALAQSRVVVIPVEHDRVGARREDLLGLSLEALEAAQVPVCLIDNRVSRIGSQLSLAFARAAQGAYCLSRKILTTFRCPAAESFFDPKKVALRSTSYVFDFRRNR